MPSKILFSACLAGFKVRYNGSDKPLPHPTLLRWQREGRLVVCCPELAAGFSTPRPSAEITPQQIAAIRFGDEGQRWQMMTLDRFIYHPQGISHLQQRLAEHLQR